VTERAVWVFFGPDLSGKPDGCQENLTNIRSPQNQGRLAAVDRSRGRRRYGRAVPDVSGSPTAPRIQVPPNCELTLGMRCVDKSQPGRTTWEMRADERFANPVGIVQGGFLSAMADSAMGSAAITFARAAGRSVIAANVEMKTSFIAAVRVGSLLHCTATIVSGGERVAFAEAEVVDDQGRTVARTSSTYLYTERAPRGGRSEEPLADGGLVAPTSL
jgi:uncharacterized protein (TIGR00369 family)